jgi:hypothetical protein
MDGQIDQHDQANIAATFISCVANMPRNDAMCGTSPEHSYYGVHSACLTHAWGLSLGFWAWSIRHATAISHQVINKKSTKITHQNKTAHNILQI